MQGFLFISIELCQKSINHFKPCDTENLIAIYKWTLENRWIYSNRTANYSPHITAESNAQPLNLALNYALLK